MFKNILKEFWPWILIMLIINTAAIGGIIWFVLYLLDTYVGKA